jgi:hypothetical protein
MTPNPKTKTKISSSRIPITLLIPLVLLAILYSFFQPWANARLGLKLPSIVQILSSDKKEPAPASVPDTPHADPNLKSAENQATAPANADFESTKQAKTIDSSAANPETNTVNPESNAGETAPYEILRKTASEVYVSAEGLRYTRGSEEGHRIKHLARHLEDMPERSGNHGVFEGGWQITLNRIDEAYRRSKQGDSKTKVRKEEDRLIIETEFNEVIGYIGGREGARKGNPTTRRLRLVTEGDRFITAFPY